MATVPIVTEVTKAQLDALVAANGLNEGLQYKVTDKGWLLIANSANSFRSISVPYKVYSAILTQQGTNAPIATVLVNEIGDIVWSRGGVGEYFATLNGAFIEGKTMVFVTPATNESYGGTFIRVVYDTDNGNYISQTTKTADHTPYDDELHFTGIEIRVYEF